MSYPRKKSVVQEYFRNHFTRLSEDTLSEIISRTSPLDAARVATLSKEFKNVADSNEVWDRFVPRELVSRSVYPLRYRSTKDLYLSLCNSPPLLDDWDSSFSLIRETGKRCFTVGAKNLMISWGDETTCNWKYHPDLGSYQELESAKVKKFRWLDITGEIEKYVLSQKTRYSAYLIFNIGDACSSLDFMSATVRRANVDADNFAEARRSKLHLHQVTDVHRGPVPRQTRQKPVRRNDGRMEIKLGSFYNWGDDIELEARLKEIWCRHGNPGLIVEGIEFRPSAPKVG